MADAFRFDDYLNLLRRPLSRYRFVGFVGCSGAGKSTYIDALLARHVDFKDVKVSRVEAGRPLTWVEVMPEQPSLIVVDEVLSFGDIKKISALLRLGHRVLAASHRPRWWHWWLRLYGPMALFQIDVQACKIETELARRGLSSTPDDISAFIARFGSNYQDLDIVLEGYCGADFNEALSRFCKFNHVDRVRLSAL